MITPRKLHHATLSLFLLIMLSSHLSYSQTFVIKGRILDADTKEYIDGASITVKGSAAGDLSVSGGNFELPPLVKNKYVISVRYQGYNQYDKIVQLEEDTNLGDILLVKYGAEGTGAAITKTIRANNVAKLLLERPNFIGGNMVYGIPPEPKKLIGDSYIDKKWNNATILLYREEELLEGFRARYNVINNMFELMEPENNLVSVMPGNRIQNIVWVDSTYKVPRYFVNGMDFKEEGAPISGFFEVLVDGELPLLRRTKIIMKESNYNEALMVGERNDELIKRNYYYYLKNNEVIEVSSNRKKFYPIFGDDAERMQKFANKNALNHKDPSSIFQLFTHYNSQFPGFVPIITQLIEEQQP